MKIPPEFTQKVKDSINLLDIVREHVVLRHVGSNHVGLCPLHSERGPSFTVSERKQVFHCHGCKKGGDLLNFYQEIHNVSFIEALEELADRAGIPMPSGKFSTDSQSHSEAEKLRCAERDRISEIHKLNRFVVAYYQQALNDQPHILGYLKQRGLDADLARSFYIGAAPPSWSALSSHLVETLAPLPLAVELGLIKPSPQARDSSGPGYFDLFRNRAVFPIIDLRGKIAGFGGRALALPAGAPDVKADSPKYLNSSESIVYQKGKLAYGLFQAQKHIREKDEVIVVEGYFDVLALHAAGFQNVVGICGTALTRDHLKNFRKLCSRVTVLFDGDPAGVKATDRAMELGLSHGIVLYGATMPTGLDPDELLFDQTTGNPLSEGKMQMKAILSSSQPLIDNRIRTAAKESENNPEARTTAIKQVAHWLSGYNDPVGYEVRFDYAVKQFGVSRQLLEKAIEAGTKAARPEKSIHPKLRSSVPEKIDLSKPPKVNPKKIPHRELLMLSAIAHPGAFRDIILDPNVKLPINRGAPDFFEYITARTLANRMNEIILINGKNAEINTTYLVDEDPQVQALLSEVLVLELQPQDLAHIEAVKLARDKSVALLWARISP